MGDRGEDFALSVFFDETEEQEWFAPHLVEFVDHGGPQTVTLDAGPSFTRDADGTWHEVGEATPVGSSFARAFFGPLARTPDPLRSLRRRIRRRRC
jgi:hypothetical protein